VLPLDCVHAPIVEPQARPSLPPQRPRYAIDHLVVHSLRHKAMRMVTQLGHARSALRSSTRFRILPAPPSRWAGGISIRRAAAHFELVAELMNCMSSRNRIRSALDRRLCVCRDLSAHPHADRPEWIPALSACCRLIFLTISRDFSMRMPCWQRPPPGFTVDPAACITVSVGQALQRTCA